MPSIRIDLETAYDAQVAKEAAEEEAKLRKRIQAREEKSKGQFTGKAGAMTNRYPSFYGGPTANEDKEAAKAFDAVQNLDESRADDLAESRRRKKR